VFDRLLIFLGKLPDKL